MAAEMFDTLAFSKRLQTGGVPAAQADTHAAAQGDLVIAYLLGQVATKADLVELEHIKALLDQMPTKADWDCCAKKEDLEGFAKKADLDCFAKKEDLEGFAKKEDLEGSAKKKDLDCFAKKEDLDGFATKADLHEMATANRKALKDLVSKMVTEEKLLLLLELRDKKMTIRLGGMILAAVVALSTFMRFMQFTGGG